MLLHLSKWALFAFCYLKKKVITLLRYYFCKLEVCSSTHLQNQVHFLLVLAFYPLVAQQFFFVILQGPADVSCQNEVAISESYVTIYLYRYYFLR